MEELLPKTGDEKLDWGLDVIETGEE